MEKDEILERFDKLDTRLDRFDERFRVVEERVSMGRGALGMLLAMCTLIGLITGLIKLFGK